MEIIKSFIEQLFYFSIIEGLLFRTYLNSVYGFEKMNVRFMLLYSLGINIIYFMLPPILKQGIMVCFMVVMINKIYDINYKTGFKIILYFMCFVLIIDSYGCSIYEFIFNIDFSKLNNFNLFLILIPIKFVEIESLIIYKHFIKTKKEKKHGNIMDGRNN